MGNAAARRSHGRAPCTRITRRRLLAWAAALSAALIAAIVLASLIGTYPIPLEPSWDVTSWPLWSSQVWRARLFRLLAAAVVGAALGGAGMATQGVLRNPLAEPYLLGISSGAGVGVLVGMSAASFASLPEGLTTPVLAVVGAIATTACVYGLAQRRGRIDPLVLLLSGAIVNVLNGAVIFVFLQLVKREQMIQYVGWSMGQVPEHLWFRPGILAISAAVVLAGSVHLFLRGTAFNALGLGDEVASSSGVSVHRVRVEAFFVVSIMTAAAVALAGPVGFVGLIVPHMGRLLFGPDHRLLAIVCGFGGALFLVAADTFCRKAGDWMSVGELPVGVVTAISGGPFFIYLLRRKLRGEGP